MERVKSDRVVEAPDPDNVDTRRERDATPEYLVKNNRDGQDGLVEAILDHQVANDGSVRFKVEWVATSTRPGNRERI